MRRIVVSATSLLWMLFSTSSLAFIFTSLFFSSGWLRRVESQDSQLWETNCLTTLNQPSPEPLVYSPPTFGPIFSCETACPGHSPARSIQWTLGGNNGAHAHCRFSLWGGGQKPAGSNAASWVGSIFLMIGSGVLLLAQWFVYLSPCKREICGRSIFQVTGLLQCVADLLLLVGLFVWPAGWGSIPVQEVCGAATAPFQKGNCEWTESPIFNFVGICLLFVSAILATLADRTIMQPSVTRQMLIADKPFIFV